MRPRRASGVAPPTSATSLIFLALLTAFLALIAPPATFSQSAPATVTPATTSGALDVVRVQNNVYAIFGAGGNITVQIGEQGPVLVDAGLAGTSDKVLAAIKTLSDKPIHDIVNTHMHADHTGGNQALSTAGGFVSGGTTGGGRRDATLYSHENVLLRMSGALGKEKPLDTGLWPGNTFFNERKELYVNGEAIELLYQPRAHTDGDVIVFFRRSDVIATGDIFMMTTFPIVDRAHGGTINGLIGGLNTLLDLAIPAPTQERGTMLVPGHGRLADEHDLLEYRDMVVVIRDRVQKMIDKGMTLEQVRTARPTYEYESRWGADTGFWTTAMFVEAVYTSLKEDKNPAQGEAR
jgi:glyoxylase-like metal-dependent hydrolase (beta-lactamase superfamily II)